MSSEPLVALPSPQELPAEGTKVCIHVANFRCCGSGVNELKKVSIQKEIGGKHNNKRVTGIMEFKKLMYRVLIYLRS